MDNPDIFQPVENFPIGSYVDISDIPNMQNVRIQNVNLGGTAIKGEIGEYVTISNQSPARLSSAKQPIIDLDKDGKEIIKRGRKKSSVEIKVEYPMEGESFTIAQLAIINGISIPQATAAVKEYCEKIGVSEKPKGQRGRASAIYRYNKV